MWKRVLGATLDGIDGVLVSVEVDAGRGLPSFQIVGQGDRVVSESRDRIRSAFRHSNLEFPPGRVTVNLAPTDLPKTGAALDLAIAVAVAATVVELSEERVSKLLLLGELGLDGSLRPVRGALALAAAAGDADLETVIVPDRSLSEAGVCPGVDALGAATLLEVVEFLRDGTELRRVTDAAEPAAASRAVEPDLAEVRGQREARRALEVAAAGGHNLLLRGPPGSGKTLLARRLPGILPDLPFAQALEATRVHGVAGTLGGRALLSRPPFRAPHHTTSDVGLLGGGRPLRPGELSLAHRGVLFLDELPEFRRSVLEALRQPLEEGEIRVVRAHGAARLPARVQLVAAMNPCPCGWSGDTAHECGCLDSDLHRYRAKLSGPLLDRIDLRVAVPRVEWEQIAAGAEGEPTAAVRARVEEARERQTRRYRGAGYVTNAELPERAVRRHCAVSGESARLLERAVDTLGLSMRAWVRVLRVARTIADLAGAELLDAEHVREALAYRPTAEAGAR